MLKRGRIKLKNINKEHEMREEVARIARAAEEEIIEVSASQTEKDKLMLLSEKELLVETIMLLKEYNTRISNIEDEQNNLDDRINSLESDVSKLADGMDETEIKGL